MDSVTYGINYRSPLNDIPFYHVANSQLPQDIMHVILEGVLSLEVKLMLSVYVSDKKYFTIDFLNERIMSFSYGKSEARNKIPKALEIDHLLSRQSKLRLSGMFWCVGWCMLLLLLFFIIFFYYNIMQLLKCGIWQFIYLSLLRTKCQKMTAIGNVFCSY